MLARIAFRRPWLVVAAAALFTAAGAVYGSGVAGRLESGGFRDPSSQSAHAERLLGQATGRDPGSTLLAVVETRAGAGLLRTFAGARAIRSLDGRELLVVVPGVSERDASRIERVLAGRPGVKLGGSPVVSNQVNRIVKTDLARAETIALPLLILLSLWVFRGFVAALLPPLVGVVTIAGALLGLRFAATLTPLSIYALNLVTGMGLGLSIDYSLFIVSRYREELAEHGPGEEALRHTMRTAGRTVLYSACTVSVALASLLVFRQRFLFSMGLGGMLVAAVGAVVSLLVLPAVLALLGTRVNSLAPRSWRRAAEAAARPASSGFWFRLAQLVMRRPLPVAAATAALLIVLGLPFLGVRFTTFSPSVLPASASGHQVDAIVRTRFPPTLNPPIYVAVGAPATAGPPLAAYAARIRRLPGAPVASPPRLVGPSTWRIDVGTRTAPNSSANELLVRRIRGLPAPYPALVGGDSGFLVDQKASLGARLPFALAVVVVATLVALFLLTGSVILPLKAITLNLLSLSAVFGVLVFVFQRGHLQGLLHYTSQGALDATQPVLIAALAFGLATDYGVFLLTRIKEAHDAGADDRTAVALGLERTGRIVTAAALLFVVAIGAFAFSRIVAIKEIGLGTASAVIIDATIVRALLVPSLMRLLGRWNWWAPGPLRRLHERLGLSAESSGDPIGLFSAWFDEARQAGAVMPEATALATATPGGEPSVRMVLLKGHDERGFVFFTSYESRKGRELEANPRAALLFYWQALGRQVRVEGAVERVTRQESEEYFRSRPAASRLSASASRQSEPIGSRQELERRVEALRALHGDDPPLPPFWGGYRLAPESIEFWVHDDDRLHHRLRYRRSGAGWTAERLSP